MKIHRVRELPVTGIANDIYLVKTAKSIKMYVRNSDNTAYVELSRRVKLLGPTSIFRTEVGTYTIQDYCADFSYTVSSADGVVSRNGSSISFVCSDVGKATASFVVNGRTFTVTIKAVEVVQPTVTSPVDGATRVSLTGTTVTATPFAVNYSGASDTQQSSDWELATDAAFANIVASSYNDATNLTSWPLA